MLQRVVSDGTWCVMQGFVDLGKIASLELNHKPVDQAKKGDSVAMKIEATTTTESTRAYGRHFDHKVLCDACDCVSPC